MQEIAAIPFTEIPAFSPLVKDYLLGKELLRSFYKYDFDLSSFEKIIADKAANKTDRPALCAALKNQYGFLSNAEISSAAIESLQDENTFTVTAAHQPCLFLGPVFNIYKIASAINLSRQLKEHFPQKNFVPVFWMGSEDHDWEELGSTFVYGKKITWHAEESNGPVGRIPTANFENAIAELETILGEPGKATIAWMRDLAARHGTLGKLTQQLVHDIFGKHGLVVIDQDDTALKTIFKPVIIEEISENRAFKILIPHLKGLEENYKVQVTPREINFFYLQKNSRQRIVNAGAGFSVLDTDIQFSKEEIEEEIESHPERFSPNVAMRPLYQEMVLPNLAFIGGAGELSYWLELQPLFAHFKINFPMLAMRPAFTVINTSQKKKWDKLNIPAVNWFGDQETLIKEYVLSQSGGKLSLQTENDQLQKIFEKIAESAAAIDVTLRASVEAEKQKAQNSIQAIEAKLLKAEKKKQEDSVNQLRLLHVQLFPEGGWQERSENFISYDLQNPNFIEEIIRLADPLDKQLKVVGSV